MQYGTKVQGRLQFMPVASLAPDETYYTQPGEVYEFQLDTEPFDNHEEAIAQLLTLEQEFADLEVVYVETCWKGKVTLQIRDKGPGSISITGVVSLIPTIFVLIGVIVVGIMLFQVMESSPILIWLLALAGGATIFYYFIGKYLPEPKKIYEKEREEVKAATETAKLREKQANLRQLATDEKLKWQYEKERLGKLKDLKDKAETPTQKRKIQKRLSVQEKVVKEKAQAWESAREELAKVS